MADTSPPPALNQPREAPNSRDTHDAVQRTLEGRSFLKRAPSANVIKPYVAEKRSLVWRLIRLGLVGAFAAFLFVYGFYFALTAPYLIVPMTFPLLVLGTVVLWAFPDIRQAPTTALEALFFAYFICLFVWPNYLALSLPGLPWITLIRLTGFPMVLTLVICVSVSKDFRDEMKGILSAEPIIWKLLVAFVVIQVLTLPMSKSPMASLQKLIVAQVNWTAIFFVSAYVFRKPGRVKRWSVLLVLLLTLACLVTLFEAWRQAVPWASHIPSFLKIDGERVDAFLAGSVRRAVGQYRSKGVFTTPLGLAEFGALSLPFVLHFILGPFGLKARLAAAATIPIVIAAILATDSRLGMVGAFMSILLYVFFWAILRWRGDHRGLIGPTLVISYPAMFCAVVSATFFVTRLKRMVWGGGAEQASNQGRIGQLETGIPKVLKNPIGYGIGEGAETLGVIGSGGVLTIDNYMLLIALEYGVVGFFIYYGLVLAGVIRAGHQGLRPPAEIGESFFVPICVTLANFFVIKAVFSQQDNHPLIFMLLGMLVALAYRRQTAETR